MHKNILYYALRNIYMLGYIGYFILILKTSHKTDENALYAMDIYIHIYRDLSGREKMHRSHIITL